jgi:predicted transposase YdaD
MQPHDSAYKSLFSNADVVRSVMLDVIQDEWVHDLNWATLEPFDASFISKKLVRRHSDLIWRVQLQAPSQDQERQERQEPRWLYVYLLFEFQSSVDPYMAVRMMSYTALLYERLIGQRVDGKKFKGKLPAVLPMVIYNGEARWRAPCNVADLIEPCAGGLQAWRPSMSHLVLDLLHLPSARAIAPGSLIGAIIDFEQAPDPEHIDALVGQLSQQLIGPKREHLREAFASWIYRYIMERFAQSDKMLELDHPKDLMELQTMTRTQAQTWKNTILQEGILAGQIQGKAQGKAEGKVEGKAEGKVEGKADALKLLLTSKFGPLAAPYAEIIGAGNLAQIETWFISALSASSLEAVFDRH